MSTSERLTRGVAGRGSLSAALDRLGVREGDDFVIAKVDPGAHDAAPDTDELGPFARDSDTSREAALANYPRSGNQRRVILDRLLICGGYGATREEITRATGIVPDAVRPRLIELVKGGWVRVTDRTRPTRRDNDAEVVVATEKAMGWWE